MTVNHRAEAEKHLGNAARHLTEDPRDMRIAEVAAAIGQGHAALAAAQDPVRDQLATLLERWEEVADSYKPMEGSKHADLEERYRNYRFVQLRAIRNLRQVLDTGTMPCELATEEEQRRGDCGKVHAAEEFTERDPWAPAPNLAAQIPEPVRRVLTEYLAAALLGKGDAHGVGQTITFALKHAGADLTPDIEKQITALTLGPDPSDPPF
ncbi:hypothetical protein [Streptomyces sp. NPDC057552]|uniref:hypothetical protein n=1 Tax=Streptomyces sp. NPDC057552 TaxID=3350537 RepID=UPI0036B2DDF6